MLSNIKKIDGYEILNSRGNATVKMTVLLEDGSVGCGSAPSGASKGSAEVVEVVDKVDGIFSVRESVKRIVPMLNSALCGMDSLNLDKIHTTLSNIGDKNLKKIGGNFATALSWAIFRAAAKHLNIPLYSYIKRAFSLDEGDFPKPMMNVINGGMHSDSGLAIQEFMIIPCNESIVDNIKSCALFYKALGRKLKAYGLTVAVGDEGGYACKLKSSDDVMSILSEVRKSTNIKVKFALDSAANSFSRKKDNAYVYSIDGKTLDSIELSRFYMNLIKKYDILSVEDPFNEHDVEGWIYFKNLIKKERNQEMSMVGDDLFSSRLERLEKFRELADGIILKPNQVGLLKDLFATAYTAQEINYDLIVSHRSGDTCDTFIADIAYALGSKYIKTGAPSRGERVSKYNRLIEIEREVKLL